MADDRYVSAIDAVARHLIRNPPKNSWEAAFPGLDEPTWLDICRRVRKLQESITAPERPFLGASYEFLRDRA